MHSSESTPTGPAGDIETRLISHLEQAAREYLRSIEGPELPIRIELQIPRNPDHGDFACNLPLQWAKALKRKPLDIAEGLRPFIRDPTLIQSPEIAPPGFINLRLAPPALAEVLTVALARGLEYGRSGTNGGSRVLVEFVSANPTGPLHIGHGRNAVVGDTLARLYEAAGYAVQREYYFNDAGVQMGLLGRSLRARYLQACGRNEPLPEDGYKGDYMIDLAHELKAEVGESRIDESDVQFFTDFAAASIMKMIRADLDALDIRFDTYFSESSLHRDGRVDAALARLRERDRVYEQDGAIWLRTTDFGDDKDRVIRKSDGSWTYLMPDIAYHIDKFGRGFDRLVNVLGADHHSYIARLKAALAGLGYDPSALHPVLIQMVGVQESGETKKLSTRSGDFDPLSGILAELSPDIVRFFFLMRAADSQLTFDLDLARQKTMDNPYWYIQYAHARCCSLMAKAEETGQAWSGGVKAELEHLSAPEERAIILQIARLPGVVLEAVAKDEPLPMTTYLRELATAFHAYFTAGNNDDALRVLQADAPPLTQARLTLIAALRTTLANGLRLLGLSPIDRL
jgi:arginyl-tRNA synthetase